MTQEEKAKRYDEAIEELRGLLEGIREEKCKILEEDIISIFPELQENEDERIRKELIFYLGDMPEDTELRNGVTNCDVLAWLEKQGDKDKLIKELGEYKAKYTQEVLEKHLRVMNKDDERLRKTTISFLKDFADKGYENAVECIDWLEKQGEQKSQGKTALEAINEEKVDNANKVEQKPTWSEKHIADVFEKVGLAKIVREQSNDALTIALQDAMIELSKVTLQPKPTTWSEEDEQITLSIEQVMNCASLLNIVPEKIDKIKTWLKSLKQRYAWKPSDEQMDALQYVYKNLNPPLSDKLGWNSLKTLELMYHDLKKLK